MVLIPIHLESPPNIQDRIVRIKEDLKDIEKFYHISISRTRETRLREFCTEEISSLHEVNFELLDQNGKVDYILLQNYLNRRLRNLDLQSTLNKRADVLLSIYAPKITQICENRILVVPIDAKKVAKELLQAYEDTVSIMTRVQNATIGLDKPSAFRAARIIKELRGHLREWYGFYNGYDPMFSWWMPSPYEQIDKSLGQLADAILIEIVGINPNDQDAIVGEPIGRQGLLAELRAEMINYSPEEILQIGEKEREWCEAELKKASQELGYGHDWKRALEYVKELYVEPGEQPNLAHQLANEAVNFVRRYDLITVPRLAEELWQTFMISPERQKANPFFLGGRSIQVSYPTADMTQTEKMMSLRGNNIHFTRAIVFHECIPGHHLQLFMNARNRPYRQLFDTPFSVEGWALYWEMILWDDKRFHKTPENRMGMLFWRLHRCARIVFSLNFHLRRMTAQQCVDYLVESVGHEPASAEGEVRRSLSGDYPPLYQVGYALGGLQLYSLRHDLVEGGFMTPKEFHDRFMLSNCMPIELFRALCKGLPLSRDYSPIWRFYEHDLSQYDSN